MHEAIHRIADFEFENGGRLAEMRVGYVTHGVLNQRRDNALLITHGTSSNRHTYDVYIGPGKAFDTDRYFVIAVDGIGGGMSSSPKDGLGMDFPRYTIRDMVKAQHLLLAEGLHLPSLVAVGGPSQGAFVALEWGIQHPDFVRGLLLIVPAARTPVNCKAVIDAMVEIVKLDPDWMGGRYTRNPSKGLLCAGMVFGTWFVSDVYLETQQSADEYNDSLMVMARAYEDWDAVSWMWRYLASREHDVSRPFAGDMAAALGRVKAQALIMPSATDRVLPTFGARELHEGIARAVYVEIPSVLGHMAQNPPGRGSAEHNFVDAAVAQFLARL